MGLGILYGQPIHYLTSVITRSPEKLAAWIKHEIPSFVGNVPSKYKEAINSVLAKSYVQGPVLQAAYQILERRGIRFDAAPNDFQVMGIIGTNPAYDPNVRQAPQMRPITKGEADQSLAYTIDEYERRYALALFTNNTNEAEIILAAVLQLLWGLAKGYGKTKINARHERLVEWNEMNTAVNEALQRATMLQTHIRFISREELASMRQAPNPNALRGLTFRIASRITTQAVPPARRGRR